MWQLVMVERVVIAAAATVTALETAVAIEVVGAKIVATLRATKTAGRRAGVVGVAIGAIRAV